MSLFPEFKEKYGPWAVVAGASEGIGQAYAHVLAESGLNVVTLARRSEPLEEDAQLIRRRHRVEVKPVALDLGSPDLATSFDEAIQGLDVGLLVYNACYSKLGRFVDTSLSDYTKSVDVNCHGPLTLAHGIAPHLIERGQGGIILMSSMAGFQGSELVSTYAATKAFNTTLAESLWAELSPQGVDVLGCVAGATLTPGFEGQTPKDKMASAFPMRPEAVAREGLASLSKGPIHVAGRINRMAHRVFGMMNRGQRVRAFSKSTSHLYADAVDK